MVNYQLEDALLTCCLYCFSCFAVIKKINFKIENFFTKLVGGKRRSKCITKVTHDLKNSFNTCMYFYDCKFFLGVFTVQTTLNFTRRTQAGYYL